MGNCLSSRRESNTSKIKQTVSTPLDAIPTAAQTIPTAARTSSAPLQVLSPPPQTDASTPPTEILVAGNPSIFNNAHSPHITGGSFNITTNVNTGEGPSLDGLFKRVAPNAIFNAGGRADKVRCHPGTRKEVISRIENWSDALSDSAAPMFWLSGPAGAGKSAIMQTVAERRKNRKAPQANFFFFRADSSRSDASPLIPTLLHQILLIYPSLKNHIATLLSDNPFILKSPLEDQVEQLIVTPLNFVQQSSELYRPLLLLIDGLDECNSETKHSQQDILFAFDQVLEQCARPSPLRVLVASRDESQIRSAFNGISSECDHLYLDDQFSPESDIRVFATAEFEAVRRRHPLAPTLPVIWPSAEDIDYIVKKSSGHFIYAATVMRFILDSSASPKLSLERIKGAARLATKSPFSQLDAIYTYILTQVEDQEAVKDILHAHLLLVKLASFYGGILRSSQITSNSKVPLTELLRLYNPRYTVETIFSCFADLTPIARHASNQHELLFYHASFSDYLQDRSRSGDYFVDVASFNYKISPMVWDIIHARDQVELCWQATGILSLLELQTFPPGLLDILALSNDVWRLVGLRTSPRIFNLIQKQCSTDGDINNLKQIIRNWVYSLGFESLKLSDVKDEPFGRRYFQMARADRFIVPDDEMMAAICPVTDFDHHESMIWLKDLLHRMHEELYPHKSERYNELSKTWISWANQNRIPINGLDNLPNV